MIVSEVETEVAEQLSEVVVDYKAMYEKAQLDLEKIAAKKDELLKETKKAKAEREEANNAAQRAAEEKATKDGEFEKLWQTTKKEKEELLSKLQEISNSNRREKIQIAAMKVATELADGDNAELLSDFVMRNLDKMADDTGAVGADVLEAVKNDFKGNQKFKSLLRSSKAAGGGAPGNLSSAQASKTMNRSDFNNLDHASRGKFLSGGGKLTD